MVYFNRIADITAAYEAMVGRYDYADALLRPDGPLALQLAALQPAESVLELATGSGRLIARAKLAVGGGYCVAVDAVQGFLNVDLPWTLAQHGLAVYPDGAAATQVHSLCANITDGGLINRVRALPGAPQRFDCIFALHVFETVPPAQRRQLLRTLRNLLSPTGRIILTMSARFSNTAPLLAEGNLPIQFRTSMHTEAPGATVLLQTHAATTAIPAVQVPAGKILPDKRVRAACQFSPDQLWTVAAAQAHAAATDAGYDVVTTRNIGKGDAYGLAPGTHSPTQAALNSMTVFQIAQAVNPGAVAGTSCCFGRAIQTACRKETPGWNQMTPEVRDCRFAQFAQAIVVRNAQQIRDANQALPAGGVLGEAQETTQVGVMVVLRRV